MTEERGERRQTEGEGESRRRGKLSEVALRNRHVTCHIPSFTSHVTYPIFPIFDVTCHMLPNSTLPSCTIIFLCVYNKIMILYRR